jgi:uracil phosphoribosyltransferase
LSLWQGARQVLPNADLCLSGIPDPVEAQAGLVLLLDQIADGTTLLALLEELQARGIEDARRLRVITAVAASPGLKRIGERMPDLTIHTACIDEALDAEGRITPGIGDPVQRQQIRSASHLAGST